MVSCITTSAGERCNRNARGGRHDPAASLPASLVVIDENHGPSLEFLTTALEGEGARIFTAQDLEEGIEIVFREHPQIVLTDLVMPGVWAQRAGGARSRGRIRSVVDMVLIAANYTTESAVEAICKGGADYLNKSRFLPCASAFQNWLTNRVGGSGQLRRRTGCSMMLSSGGWSDGIRRAALPDGSGHG